MMALPTPNDAAGMIASAAGGMKNDAAAAVPAGRKPATEAY
jgi:hypothetical protein